MDIHNFVLSYYQNSADGLHIQRIHTSTDASKPHTHDYFQIYYIARGRLTHYVENASSVLSRGDMFIIPPGSLHYIAPGPDADFYTFSFQPDIFGETNHCNRLVNHFLSTLTANREIQPKITLPSEELLPTEGIMEQMLKNFTAKPLGYGEALRAYGVLLLTQFARLYYESMPLTLSPGPENNRQAILHCVQYIKDNFAENITLSDITRMCSMSKSCFCDLFRQVTGTSFRKYLSQCRIEKAIHYIRQGYKITAIYGLCGYNDFSTFYRNFKEVTGLSPESYRRINCRNAD